LDGVNCETQMLDRTMTTTRAKERKAERMKGTRQTRRQRRTRGVLHVGFALGLGCTYDTDSKTGSHSKCVTPKKESVASWSMRFV